MKNYLAQSCNTYSKRETCYAANVKPGAISWVCGLGSQLIGWEHNPEYTAPEAYQLAELICKRWKWDRVKFCSSGSEACSAAVRIARAYTGKKLIYHSDYHGWHDWTIAGLNPSKSHIPCQKVIYFKSVKNIYDKLYDDLTFGMDNKNISSVIIEPLKLNADALLLKSIKKICHKLNILLIFDEIITGLRVPTGTVSSWLGVKPDLLVMGKAAGNGLPISWVCGPKKIMDNPDYFVSSTHAGNIASCKAAIKTIKETTDEKLDAFFVAGNKLQSNIRTLMDGTGIDLVGYGTRAEWQCSDLKRLTSFWELMAARGHRLGRAFFLNFNHTPQMRAKLLEDIKAVVPKIGKPKYRAVSFAFSRN